MNAETVVILGGGVGGLVAANELARRLPRGHRIVLVERSATHAFAPSFLWPMTGGRRAEQITRDLRVWSAPASRSFMPLRRIGRHEQDLLVSGRGPDDELVHV